MLDSFPHEWVRVYLNSCSVNWQSNTLLCLSNSRMFAVLLENTCHMLSTKFLLMIYVRYITLSIILLSVMLYENTVQTCHLLHTSIFLCLCVCNFVHNRIWHLLGAYYMLLTFCSVSLSLQLITIYVCWTGYIMT